MDWSHERSPPSSTSLGVVGLTLTHIARWWNPAVKDQCTGRALEISQEKTVYVHIPMATLADGQFSFDDAERGAVSSSADLLLASPTALSRSPVR